MTINIQCTRSCNFSCTYCYERKDHRDLHLEGESLDRTKKIIDELSTTLNKSNLLFIGGEPTNNQKNSTDIINWAVNKNIIDKVTIITNGSNLQKIIDFRGNLPKERYIIQISYDGLKINEMFRRTKNNKSTTDLVLKNILELRRLDYTVVLKSTIAVNMLHLVPDIIKEFAELGLSYNVTEDFTTLLREGMTTDKFKENLDYIRSSFTEILKTEISLGFEKPAISRWFQSYDTKLKHSCNAGVTFINISVDGIIQYCHHIDSIKDTKKLEALSITKESDPIKQVQDLKRFSTLTKELIPEADSECNSCPALYCTKCTVLNKGDTLKELVGKHSNDFQCIYFKEISKFIKIYDDRRKQYGVYNCMHPN